MQVLTSSESNKWYTPKPYTDMAREVMGSIDLDPASSPLPQRWIGADVYFTQHDDGLSKPWHVPTDTGGRSSNVWINPPYGKTGAKSNQEVWADKLISEIKLGHVLQAVMLTKTVPGYNWWDRLFNGLWPGPMCITRGRIAFVKAEELEYHYHVRNKVDPEAAITGMSKAASSFWYYGPYPDRFERVFSQVGRVIWES